MANILQTIARSKRVEVDAMRVVMPLKEMKRLALSVNRPVISMRDSILAHKCGIIAEHKRRSPSKGEICPMSSVARVAREYAIGGASAMSILTDTPYFGGSLTDLSVARTTAPFLPLLRKEFIIDEYQVYQARYFGADAILLIAAMIDGDTLSRLNDTAHEIGLQTLVELHSEHELSRLPSDADMVGINNRDLTNFTTDVGNSFAMIDTLPKEMVKIAESGIKTPDDIIRLRSVGFNGFLIGEAFMSTPEPGETLHEFIDAVEGRKTNPSEYI